MERASGAGVLLKNMMFICKNVTKRPIVLRKYVLTGEERRRRKPIAPTCPGARNTGREANILPCLQRVGAAIVTVELVDQGQAL